jgi:hypothetical protein
MLQSCPQEEEDKDSADGDGPTEGHRQKARRKVDRSSTFLRDLVRESIRSSHKRPKSNH